MITGFLVVCCVAAVHAATQPNVVVIMTDDQDLLLGSTQLQVACVVGNVRSICHALPWMFFLFKIGR
jgi:hypothetical protein